MPVGRTRDIQPVGRIELFRVAVRRADAEIQQAAGRQLDTPQSGIHGSSPISKLIRTLESKKLLDSAADQFRIPQQCAALIRPAETATVSGLSSLASVMRFFKEGP